MVTSVTFVYLLSRNMCTLVCILFIDKMPLSQYQQDYAEVFQRIFNQTNNSLFETFYFSLEHLCN
jgi:hypothetical protein